VIEKGTILLMELKQADNAKAACSKTMAGLDLWLKENKSR